MVGYYQSETISTAPMMPMGNSTTEAMKTVKNLVCSPDLTVFASAPTSSNVSSSQWPTETRMESAVMTVPTRNEDKSYQCLLCQKIFEQKSLYQSHLRSHGKDGEDPYRCNICGKTFAVPARLTRHYRTHTGEKPYQCEYCSKSFSVKENLSVHRRIHTKERPYKCDVCERAFEHSGKLHRHMRIHTGERPHKCTVCSKTFIQSGQLVIHMRTHTGEKPYVCKACGKGFTCSKQLKVHTRTHTGEKPYTCDICGKSFGYNHVLKLHQVAHYGEKVYKCTLCHETFGSKKTMELHIKTHSDSSSSSSSPSSVSSSGAISPRDSPIEPMIEISQELGDRTNRETAGTMLNVNDLPLPSGCNSDKENDKTDEGTSGPYNPQKDSYYIYPREQLPQQQDISQQVIMEERNYQQPLINLQPVEQNCPVPFFYPDMVSGYSTNFALQSCEDLVDGTDCSSLILNLPGNDARRRVEAALEAVEEQRQREREEERRHGEEMRNRSSPGTIEKESMLTPPSSNPVSPAPSFSPDPLDLAIPPRETLILPPRKRCKMILQSMESERSNLLAAQRQNSVIQFAKAS